MVGVPAWWACAAFTQGGELVGVGVEDPAVGWDGQAPSLDPAFACPGVQGDRWHAEFCGEVIEPPLLGPGLLAGRGGGSASAVRWEAELFQEVLDGADTDRVAALGRAEPFSGQNPCDRAGPVALLGEFPDACDELGVVAELLQGAHGADRGAGGGVPMRPR